MSLDILRSTIQTGMKLAQKEDQRKVEHEQALQSMIDEALQTNQDRQDNRNAAQDLAQKYLYPISVWHLSQPHTMPEHIIHSDDPSDTRVVMKDGSMLREGDGIAGGLLRVKKIDSKGGSITYEDQFGEPKYLSLDHNGSVTSMRHRKPEKKDAEGNTVKELPEPPPIVDRLLDKPSPPPPEGPGSDPLAPVSDLLSKMQTRLFRGERI